MSHSVADRAWLEFFLKGVKETVQQVADTSKEILTIIEEDRRKIEELGRSALSVLRVHQHLQCKPMVTIPATGEQLSLSAPTVAKALPHTVKPGTVRETTGRQRHRPFTDRHYLEILNRGTELPKASPDNAHASHWDMTEQKKSRIILHLDTDLEADERNLLMT